MLAIKTTHKFDDWTEKKIERKHRNNWEPILILALKKADFNSRPLSLAIRGILVESKIQASVIIENISKSFNTLNFSCWPTKR